MSVKTEEKLACDASSMPLLASGYPVADAMVRQFQADGHVFCPGLLNRDESAAYLPDLAALGHQAEDRRSDHYRSFNNWEKSPVARKIVFSKRIAEVAAWLLGCHRVQVHQDSIFLKLPGHRISNYHFDVAASPFLAPAECGIRYLTCWIPLSDLEPESGHLEFVRGSHKLPFRNNREAAEYLGNRRPGIEPDRVSYRNRRAGDASFHSGRTLHTGLPNRTGQSRVALAIQYFAVGTRIDPMAANYLESCKYLDSWVDQQQASGHLSAFEARQQKLRRGLDERWVRHYKVSDRIRRDEPLLPLP